MIAILDFLLHQMAGVTLAVAVFAKLFLNKAVAHFPH